MRRLSLLATVAVAATIAGCPGAAATSDGGRVIHSCAELASGSLPPPLSPCDFTEVCSLGCDFTAWCGPSGQLGIGIGESCRDSGVRDGGPPLDAAPDAGRLDADLDASALDAALDASDLDALASDALELDGAVLDAAELDAAGDGGDLDADLADASTPDAPRLPLDASFDAAGCGTIVTEHPPVASPHVTACNPVTYDSNPPTSGPHYPSWPAFGVYASPVPWGYLVHALEHGAVVVAYDCPAGCDAELALLLDYLDLRPADPLCSRDVHHRVIVVPDPSLGTRFAASAWGWELRSDCFDLDALGAFMDAHYAQAPENFCADGATGLGCP